MRLEMNVLGRIQRKCMEKSDKIAVWSGGEGLTYDQLWEKSDRLASWILKNNENKKPIVVYGSKSPYMFVCFLACVKAGYPYCPVDISMPESRVRNIIDTIGAPLVMATEYISAEGCTLITANEIYKISVEHEIETAILLKKNWVQGDETFYIIFTSGSTGKPKGVKISEYNLRSFINWSVKYFNEDMPVLNQAALSFDLSVMDVYSSLINGNGLYCLGREMQSDIEEVISFVKEHRIGYIVSTPSFTNMMLASPNFNKENLKHLKKFRFCGEKLTKETCNALFERFYQDSIVNFYGPTETTVAVTSVDVTPELCGGEEDIPIGIPKPGTELRIIDGEIIIAGDTVSSGYYKDKEKTDKSFYIDEKGNKCYRTGDLGYKKNDMYYFNGRLDSQIKFHGYRIELQDIETNLLEIEEIAEAVVLTKKKEDTIKSIIGIVVLNDPEKTPKCAPEAFNFSKKVREQMGQKLPKYMVPKKIIFIKKMPLNLNGKIDRERLGELI